MVHGLEDAVDCFPFEGAGICLQKALIGVDELGVDKKCERRTPGEQLMGEQGFVQFGPLLLKVLEGDLV